MLFDETAPIVLPGLDPGRIVTIRLEQHDSAGLWRSHGIFVADAETDPRVADEAFRARLRVAPDPERTALALLAAGRELDPDLRVLETKTMDRHLALMRLPQQLSAFVLSAFGMLALALAAVGLYGVVSYGVSRRTREIGIRQALGADGPRVVRLLVAGGLKLVVLGGALGLALAVVATRLPGGLLFVFEVDALDPLTFVGVPLVLGAAALLAAWLPARRASRVSPVVALRTD